MQKGEQKTKAGIRQALIIAAGRGERFGPETDSRPKPLIEVGGVPLLTRVLRTARRAGIDRFTIVTGYRGEILEDFLRRGKYQGLHIECIRNKDWRRPNGWSVLRGKGEVRCPFILLMSDHLFDARIIRNLAAVPLLPGRCRLAVDFHPERVPDPADATKVLVRGGRVAAIGKQIESYNGVDTGIFLCTEVLFEALETCISRSEESLSDGIRELAGQERMEAMDIGDLFWQDIDDEAGRLEAERRLPGLHPR